MHAPSVGAIALSSLASLASAAPQTLYGVSFYTSYDPSDPFSIIESETAIFSPVGTATDRAATTYVEEIIATYEANDLGTTTEVLVSAEDPVTAYITFAESSGGFVASQFVPSSVQSAFSETITGALPVESCVFSADGQAQCNVFIPIPAGPSGEVSVVTQTLSGTVLPIATLSQSKSAAASQTAKTSGSERIVARLWATVLAGVGAGAFLLVAGIV
ncbi:GH16 domain-containing protein [Mycena chlorophos]|uniref:GH16 domain-containing protein n=1 Tax=Mycena chlorophos TaxID=658473 RepID=A0A8H6RXA3_MYCCL|nr:GH16 domain-containing protein [Mycena chlorophos]